LAVFKVWAQYLIQQKGSLKICTWKYYNLSPPKGTKLLKEMAESRAEAE